MRGWTVIEVCDANPACTQELFNLEAEFPFASVLETACMSQCDLCAQRPYVFLNEEIIAAEQVPELIKILRQRLQAMSESDDL